VAELRPHVQELRNKGAVVAVIGNGWPGVARRFVRDLELPPEVRVLTDHSRESYRLAGFHRGIWRTLGPAALANSFDFLRRGFRQKGVQGDPWQQGGTLVVAKGGDVLFSHASANVGDHPPPERLIAALA
jgi:hypothetical protein